MTVYTGVYSDIYSLTLCPSRAHVAQKQTPGGEAGVSRVTFSCMRE